MGVSSVRKMASEILKCGQSRIRMEMTKEVEEALTREDVKKLIRSGIVWKVQKKGTSKFHTKFLLKQKKKGRRTREGSRKGKFGARNPRKKQWIKTIRALRRLLKELKDNGQIDSKTYTEFYPRVKGGEFRNKKHLLFYLDDHDLLKHRKELKISKPKKQPEEKDKEVKENRKKSKPIVKTKKEKILHSSL